MSIEFDPNAAGGKVLSQMHISMMKESLEMQKATAMKLINGAATVTENAPNRAINPTHVGNKIDVLA